MFWWFFRWFWRPQYRYEIILGSSQASAEDARNEASLRLAASLSRVPGEVIGIAADAMCCAAGDPEKKGSLTVGSEWDVYLLIRR